MNHFVRRIVTLEQVLYWMKRSKKHRHVLCMIQVRWFEGKNGLPSPGEMICAWNAHNDRNCPVILHCRDRRYKQITIIELENIQGFLTILLGKLNDPRCFFICLFISYVSLGDYFTEEVLLWK
jgi:hypothetical protein